MNKLSAEPCEKLPDVGIAFIDGPQKHVGILYKLDGSVYILDLAFHHLMRNEKVCKNYLWGGCPWIYDDNAIVIIARLMSLNSNTKIPYGFRTDNICFNRDLKYTPIPIGQGLTCASFVLVVFQALEYEILECKGWQKREEDEKWQNLIIESVRKHDPAQADAMEGTIGAFRFRPEEVAAAALSDDVPLEFSAAIVRAEQLLKDIEDPATDVCEQSASAESEELAIAANSPSTDAIPDAPVRHQPS